MRIFNKRLLVIFIVYLLTLSILAINYTSKIETFKEELDTLNEEMLVKDNDMLLFKNQIENMENEYLPVQDKIDEYASIILDLSEDNQSLTNVVKSKQALIQEATMTIKELTEVLDQMVVRVNTSFIYDNFLIDFYLTENKAISLFGKPNENIIEIYGPDDIWYLEGLYSKESIYDKFTLFYQGDTEGDDYKLIGYSTSSIDLRLTKDIKVTDSLETLVGVYPMLNEDTWRTEGRGLFYQDMYSMTAIYFEIENESISKITVSTIID